MATPSAVAAMAWANTSSTATAPGPPRRAARTSHQKAAAVTTKLACSPTCTTSWVAAASYSAGTCHRTMTPTWTPRATTTATGQNRPARPRWTGPHARRARRRGAAGRAPASAGTTAPSARSGAATARSSTCWPMWTASDRSEASSIGPAVAARMTIVPARKAAASRRRTTAPGPRRTHQARTPTMYQPPSRTSARSATDATVTTRPRRLSRRRPAGHSGRQAWMSTT